MVTDEPPQPEETADKDIQDEYSEIFKKFWYSMTKNSPRAYILKAKKFAEPLFQLKKIAEKVR